MNGQNANNNYFLSTHFVLGVEYLQNVSQKDLRYHHYINKEPEVWSGLELFHSELKGEVRCDWNRDLLTPKPNILQRDCLKLFLVLLLICNNNYKHTQEGKVCAGLITFIFSLVCSISCVYFKEGKYSARLIKFWRSFRNVL